ncbi:hypothetical protein JX265_008005 [Neoarthrinium moseri]|uniref:Uncharacterized protein n=1 Tax=Neoarthrinium moseri TaxID=1658444 RepID=A0A9P9WJ26_9PEZI|nr:hypothetical protein JX265_008005 [Neoarthrinium moseri]
MALSNEAIVGLSALLVGSIPVALLIIQCLRKRNQRLSEDQHLVGDWRLLLSHVWRPSPIIADDLEAGVALHMLAVRPFLPQYGGTAD